MIFVFRELLIFAILSILGMITNIDHVFGVYFLSADISRLLNQQTPVWAVLFTVLLKLENIPSFKALDGILKTTGIILGILGTIITVTGRLKFKYKLSKRLLVEIVGYICVISSPAVLALQRAIIKKYLYTQGENRWKSCSVFTTVWILLFSAAGSLVLSLFYVTHPQTFLSIKGPAIIPLIYLLLLNNVITCVVINWCTTHLSATAVTAFWPLQIVFCVVISYIL